MTRLASCPLDFATACEFIAAHHRHHRPPRGHKFSIGAVEAGEVVGVVIVGRPTARGNQDGWTLEITRLCTMGGHRNVASFLYGAAARATFALGYRRIGTYILAHEQGVSLKAAGWRCLGIRGGGSWSTPSRPRVDKHPIGPKQYFMREIAA